jgi:hypothetical protein
MLSEAKHLWLFISALRQKASEIESLASRTSSAALQLRFAQSDKKSLVKKPGSKFSIRALNLTPPMPFRRITRSLSVTGG